MTGATAPDHHRPAATDPQWFRQVLGTLPTAVSVVSASPAARNTDTVSPATMVVGSVVSVSLDPPMIAVLPAKTSTTWPRIAAGGEFCVSVLGSGQEQVCHTVRSRDADAISSLSWTPTTVTASPALDDAVAWIDCRIRQTVDAGDHHLVLADVLDLMPGPLTEALLFVRGAYDRPAGPAL